MSTLWRLAFADYRHEALLSACAVLALAAVLAPLLILFGLKFGILSTLEARLLADPAVREIVPIGSGRYTAADIAALAERPETAFVLARTRPIAASADIYPAGGGQALHAEMLPTAAGDPLLDGEPPAAGEMLLSQGLAERLGAWPGQSLMLAFGRSDKGRQEYVRLSLKLKAVLPLSRFARDGVFVPLPLLEAVEDYRDGLAVPAFGWPGRVEAERSARRYPAFRLYARELDDVERLRRYFQDKGQEVQTQAGAIVNLRALSGNLGAVFWIVAGVAVLGAGATLAASGLAAVARKRRELSVLRLLGLSSRELVLFPVLQAGMTAGLGLAASALGYALAAGFLDRWFAKAGETACRLLGTHWLLATLLTLAVVMGAAAWGGWRAAQIQASEGIRDV
ncbi:MAG: ABC transporter permease [Gammaproteobacteria bacterium]|nr:ABC transporter permease [Gammaproteobacteria bacterium]